jgi:hypothetical protein
MCWPCGFKDALSESWLARAVADQGKLAGMESADSGSIERMYADYLKSFHDGVYDLITEDYNPVTQQLQQKRYFTGGVLFKAPAFHPGVAVPGQSSGMKPVQVTLTPIHQQPRPQTNLTLPDSGGATTKDGKPLDPATEQQVNTAIRNAMSSENYELAAPYGHFTELFDAFFAGRSRPQALNTPTATPVASKRKLSPLARMVLSAINATESLTRWLSGRKRRRTVLAPPVSTPSPTTPTGSSVQNTL